MKSSKTEVSEENYTKRVAHGSILILLAYFLGAVLSYLLRFTLARELTKAEYGLFYATLAFIGILSIFKDLGLSTSLIKFIPEFKVQKKFKKINSLLTLVFSVQFVVSVLIAAVIFLMSDYLAINYFKAPAYAFLIKIMAFVFLLSFTTDSFLAPVFVGMQKITRFFFLDVLRNAFVYLITLFFLFQGLRIYAPAYAYVVAYIALFFIFSMLFLREFLVNLLRFKINFDKPLLRKVFGFSVPMALALMGTMVITYTDTLSLTYFRSLEEVAIYQAALPISMFIWYFATAVSGMMLPITSELRAKEKKQSLYFAVKMIQSYSFVIVIPFALIMFLFPEIIIRMLFGEKYMAAAAVLKILSIAGIFYTIYFINNTVIAGLGKPLVSTKMMLKAALFNLVLNIILVPRYGVIGAATATTLSYGLLLILSSWNLKKLIPVQIPVYNWIKTLVAGAVFVLVVNYLKNYLVMNQWAEMVVTLGIAFVLYSLLVLLLRVVKIEDIRSILKQIRS